MTQKHSKESCNSLWKTYPGQMCLQKSALLLDICASMHVLFQLCTQRFSKIGIPHSLMNTSVAMISKMIHMTSGNRSLRDPGFLVSFRIYCCALGVYTSSALTCYDRTTTSKFKASTSFSVAYSHLPAPKKSNCLMAVRTYQWHALDAQCGCFRCGCCSIP